MKTITCKTKEQQIAALTYLFSVGFKAGDKNHTTIQSCQDDWGNLWQWPTIIFDTDSHIRLYGGDAAGSCYEKVSWDEFFRIKTAKNCEFKLNEDYTAVITSDGKINVGCQVFTLATVKALVARAEKICS